jgi:NAD(P)-dependent dehydrogenase (short-subunit alcohol dehydrogenase family)
MNTTDTSPGTVVVVGGSRGLGWTVAQTFAARGYSVLVLARSRPRDIDAYPRMFFRTLDFAELDAQTTVDRLAPIVAEFADIRYVVFCQRYRGSAQERWQGEWHMTVTVTRELIEALLPHMVPSGDRAFAIVSSNFADRVGLTQGSEYHVAKAAVNQLGRYYAVHLGKRGVRVNIVSPFTFMKPESTAHFLADESKMKAYADLVPLGRLATTDDIAALLAFLCSPQASYISGQCIAVDGALSAVWPEDYYLPLHQRVQEQQS